MTLEAVNHGTEPTSTATTRTLLHALHQGHKKLEKNFAAAHLTASTKGFPSLLHHTTSISRTGIKT